MQPDGFLAWFNMLLLSLIMAPSSIQLIRWPAVHLGNVKERG